MQIVDARPAGRFEGKDPEPRPGLGQGHIPGSKNVPSQSILNADGTLKPTAELEKIFKDAGIDPAQARGDDVRVGRDRLDAVTGTGRARANERCGL